MLLRLACCEHSKSVFLASLTEHSPVLQHKEPRHANSVLKKPPSAHREAVYEDDIELLGARADLYL